MKELGAMWSGLSEKEKEPYRQMAALSKPSKGSATDGTAATEEAPARKPRKSKAKGREAEPEAEPEAAPKKGRAKAKAKAVAAVEGPRKPLTAFFLFMMDLRKQRKISAADAGALWKEASPAERQRFETLAAMDKENYEAQRRALGPQSSVVEPEPPEKEEPTETVSKAKPKAKAKAKSKAKKAKETESDDDADDDVEGPGAPDDEEDEKDRDLRRLYGPVDGVDPTDTRPKTYTFVFEMRRAAEEVMEKTSGQLAAFGASVAAFVTGVAVAALKGPSQPQDEEPLLNA